MENNYKKGGRILEDGLPDRIARSFDGKTVLLSGGTGFMGKIVIEKILRMCPDIKQIILIIREKKGKEPRQRLEQIFQGEVFEYLVKERGMQYLMSRTTAVAGDVAVDGLAISAADRQKCTAANIIIHSAACVRFDQGLKEMVSLNTRGTKCMLELAKECPNLQLFIHVSTAYCHPDVKVLEEVCYPPPADPHQLITLIENSTNDVIQTITPKLLGAWPNTYVYSKALAEALVADEMKNLPAMIIRPSVVIPVYREPIPGWTDNINGPAGLLIAAGKGVLRTMYGDENNYADFIPVDVFASALMIAVWNNLGNSNIQRVFNCTSSDEIRISWGEMLDIGRRVTKRIPLNHAAWYPGGSMTRYRIWHQIRSILFHWIPAILVDTLLFCIGIKPVLMRVHRRIHKGMEVFEYYTSNQWEFKSDAVKDIRDRLNKREKMAYKIDSEGFDVEQYFEVSTLSCRRFILKETDDTLPAARRHMMIMWCLDLAVKIAFIGTLVYWLYGYVASSGFIKTFTMPYDNFIN